MLQEKKKKKSASCIFHKSSFLKSEDAAKVSDHDNSKVLESHYNNIINASERRHVLAQLKPS